MSDANRTSIRYLTESTWNLLPDPASLTTLRLTGESFTPEVENIVSAELRSDRMIADLIQAGQQVSGGFDFELSYGTFDELIQGALLSAWAGTASNVITNGVTEVSNSFSIEKAHLDIDEYFLFTGMMVNEFSLNLSTSAIATGSFGFMGSTTTLIQAANSATVASAATTNVMNCMGDVASLKEAAYASSLTNFSGVYIQELSLSINNNLRPIMSVGSNVLQEIALGKMDVTGTLSAYFSSARLFDKFLAGTAFQLEFQITDGTNSYTVLIPKAKFETDSIPAPGQDQDVIESLGWRAIRDPTLDAQIRITRSG